MSDEYIQLPEPARKKSFLRGWKGFVLLLLLCVLMAGGYFSWWVASGRINSAFASVDAIIYTVEPEAPVIVKEVLVKKGEQVFPGQPLAMIEVEQAPSAENAANESFPGVMPVGEINGRLDASESMERNMSVRLAQARAQEERYLHAHQNMVTEHVRSQLVLRATDPGNMTAWAQANAQEQAARARMEAAREEYEKFSKMRAAMDTELARIRMEILRKKNLAAKNPPKPQPEKPAPPPQPKMVDTTLLAPANGRIIEVYAAAGQQARQGQALFYIMPSEKDKNVDMWVQAWFPETDREKLKVGQNANIRIEKWQFTGKIAEIAQDVQYLSDSGQNRGAGGAYGRYIGVKINVDDPAALAEITPGSRAECQVQTHTLSSL